MLVTSIFSFSHHVFTLVKKTYFHFSFNLKYVAPSQKLFHLPFPKQALVFTCTQYKSFENTLGKGEIARNEQFLLFPQCFLLFWVTFYHLDQIWNCRLQTLSIWKRRNLLLGKGLRLTFTVWKWVNPFPSKPWFLCVCMHYESFENTVGKGEIAGNKKFILFPQCFLTHLENFLPFSSNLKLSSANSSSLEKSKTCRLGNG